MVSGIPGVIDRGVFIISLDFELAWGFHDKNKAWGNYKKNILGARVVIPKLLELFTKYDIHASWAVVGALGCKSRNELITLINKDLVYKNEAHSLYSYILDKIGENEEDDPMHFAGSLVSLIRKYPHQSIASHTFSHFYLMKPTLHQDDFEKDVAAFKTVFPEACCHVFARNQVSQQGVSVLEKYGFYCYRGVQKNNSWYPIYEEREKNPLFTRALRLIDTYVPLTGYYDYPWQEPCSGNLVNLPASAFLRPYTPRLRFLEALKLKRIKAGMRRAAQKGTIFHIYWHPHNIGIHQEINLANIEQILSYYQELNKEFGMVSMSMEDAAGGARSGVGSI